MRIFSWIAATLAVLASGAVWAGPVLVAQSATMAPVVDGKASDTIWAAAEGLVTHDPIAGIDLELKALRSGDNVYFLVRYPDPECSTTHRSWTWNSDLGEYEPGNDREDVFVFKWFISGDDTDLSLSSVQPYVADIWFWKACRTNPVGYADDKFHVFGVEPGKNARELVDRAGGTKFLNRLGDAGSAAYKTRLVIANEGDRTPRFAISAPTGSRADVRATGTWSAGFWTIEFSRPLLTGHEDDVQFSPSGQYRFGVSRYEIAGRPADPAATEPKYGCGDVAEIITLRFAKPGEGTVW